MTTHSQGNLAGKVVFWALILVAALFTCASAQKQQSDIKTEGTCSPNIVENKGQVRFTCNGVIDAKTAQKIVAILNELLRKQNDPAAVSAKLDEILAFIHRQAEQSAEEERNKRLAEQKRRTAPLMHVELLPVGAGRVRVNIWSDNLIPFEFRYVIVTRDNLIVSGIMTENGKIFPTTEKRLFYEIASIDQDRMKDSYLELRFRFQSLSADELDLPGHRGQIIQKYKTDASLSTLQPVP